MTCYVLLTPRSSTALVSLSAIGRLLCLMRSLSLAVI